MKNLKYALVIVALLGLLIGTTALAQYTGGAWYTAYQVVNMSDTEAADITIKYYDESGAEQVTAEKNYVDVAAGGSVLVVQYSDDPNLSSGRYSAVISADQPVAAIANIQWVPDSASSYNPVPPFSTYSGQSAGSTSVTLPAVMYNWYGYYTEVFIMNVDGTAASDVDITYVPGEMDLGSGAEATGASGVTDNDNTIPGYATIEVSQESLSGLGASGGTFTGRFLGSALIESDRPVIAVVNQHNTGDHKLMTYNGFTSAGATEILVPTHMRGYYGYYTTMLISNPSETTAANVTVEYTPDTNQPNEVAPGSTIGVVSANHSVAPQTAVTRYDGPGASDNQSDLDDGTQVYTRFFGSAKVTSDMPVMVQINVEAEASGAGQAGSFNGIPTDEASGDIVAPVILADYYGYYTTLIVQNATGTAGSCSIEYASDGTYSAVPNATKSYTHALPANGSFTVYEGRAGGANDGDVNSDTFWRASGSQQFIGAATITCDVDAVAFVNEEYDSSQTDSMYTMNTFNK